MAAEVRDNKIFDRDQRLGPWGLYSTEMTDRIGLKMALIGTRNHLLFGLSKTKEQGKAEDEISRLGQMIARM